MPASVASFNGTTLTTTYVCSTRLTVTVPASLTTVWSRYHGTWSKEQVLD